MTKAQMLSRLAHLEDHAEIPASLLPEFAAPVKVRVAVISDEDGVIALAPILGDETIHATLDRWMEAENAMELEDDPELDGPTYDDANTGAEEFDLHLA